MLDSAVVVEGAARRSVVAFQIIEEIINDFSVVEADLSQLFPPNLDYFVNVSLASGVSIVDVRVIGVARGRSRDDFRPPQGGTVSVVAQLLPRFSPLLWRLGMFIEYRGKRPKVAASAFVAPTAVLIGDVEVGEESSVWFGVVIRGDNGPIRIGNRTSVQDNAVVHVSRGSQTTIGDDCTIGHSVTMEDCTIEDGALVGSNAVVLNGATVGSRALVAAGSVVAANASIPPESLAAGSPAVVKRKLEGESLAWVDRTPGGYVELSRSYLHHGIGDPEMQETVDTQFAP